MPAVRPLRAFDAVDRRLLGRRPRVALAVVVAASRVYLGVHYPTDVAAGLLLGWIWGWLALRVVHSQEL